MKEENLTNPKQETKSFASYSPQELEKLRQEQILMVEESELRTGQKWGTAFVILQILKEPMTQEDFLRTEGIRLDIDDLLMDEEMMQDLVPEWFLKLPRGESPGLY